MSDLRSAIEAAVTSTANETPAPEVQSTPAPEVQSTPAPEQSVSTDSASTAPDSASTAPDTGSAPAPAERKPGETPNIEEVVGENAAPAPKNETAEQREARQRVDRAPQSWKGESKKLWEQLPLQVRQEVARREHDVMVTMKAAAQDRGKVSAIEQAIAPHRERIQSVYGGNPVAAINNLLQVEAVLMNAPVAQKAQMVANMVKQFGIDIRALDSALAGVEMPTEVTQQSSLEQLLEQKLAPVQQFIQSQQQREQQQREKLKNEALQTVEQMSQDERYPYFDEVRNDMIDIIEMQAKRGVALSLHDAYTRAVRMNDGVFQASTVRDQSQGATNSALEAHRAAQAAKGASVSVSGSPSSTGRNVGNPSDLRGTIEAAYGGGRL